MRLLLDTHALIWFGIDHPQLSPRVRKALESPDNEVFVSAATAYELALKHRLGKLEAADDLAAEFVGEVNGRGFVHLPITAEHALFAARHPSDHRDPFDRILAAQGLIEELALVSKDPALDSFGVSRFW